MIFEVVFITTHNWKEPITKRNPSTRKKGSQTSFLLIGHEENRKTKPPQTEIT